MQTEEKKKKTWDPSHYRQQQMTFWPQSHPVMFPHTHTDHWTKMKTKVPVYLVSVPAAMVTGKVRSYNTKGDNVSLQNLPQYRNEYNDRAKRGFCYWPIEKKAPKCHGHSFGAYKTLLGLPRI